MCDKAVILEEYKTLRQEMLKNQETRYIILGFTITSLGILLGLSLKEAPATTTFPGNSLALIVYAFLIIGAAVWATIHHTQNIDRLGGYIREVIEPQLPELHWETVWMGFRESLRKAGSTQGLPMGTSKIIR